MLLSGQANQYAQQLLDIRANSRQIPPLSDSATLSLQDGYDIAQQILELRGLAGEVIVGRKLGFTDRTIWPKLSGAEQIVHPIWAPMYDTTVRYARHNVGLQSLYGAMQPRIEPEIVFKLARTPAPDATPDNIAESIEWMAHGFEIVVSPFPDWKFEAVDAIAAFGLHGSLIIGEPTILSAASCRNLAEVLAMASISLSCGCAGVFSMRGAGFGSDVLDSPVHALWQLHRLLQSQPQFAPLTAGEIISTGSWTEAYPIEAGQTWTSAFSGISLPGLTVSFV